MTVWMNAKAAAKYIGANRSAAFVRREIAAGRLRAAKIGGRHEIVTCSEWLDQYIVDQTTPIVVLPTKRRA